MEFDVFVFIVDMDIGIRLSFLDPFLDNFLFFFSFQPVLEAHPVIFKISRMSGVIRFYFDDFVLVAYFCSVKEKFAKNFCRARKAVYPFSDTAF